MRRAVLLVTVAALATWVGDAAFASTPVLLRTPGAEFIELGRGNGRAVITRRGSVNVNLRRRGHIRVVDLPGGGRPNVRCNKAGVRIRPSTVQFRGPELRCLVSSGKRGGPWQTVIRGRGIFASGVVRGSLTLDGADRGPTGVFRIGAEGGWRDWPRNARTYGLDRT
jgi:hypothetical protein